MSYINCPCCDNEIWGREYYDGGDPPITPPYWYWKCHRCGWYDSDDVIYEDELDAPGEIPIS